jgi:hypothetical protein
MLRGEDGGRLDQWEWQLLLPPGGISSSLLAHVRLACLSSAEAVLITSILLTPYTSTFTYPSAFRTYACSAIVYAGTRQILAQHIPQQTTMVASHGMTGMLGEG